GATSTAISSTCSSPLWVTCWPSPPATPSRDSGLASHPLWIPLQRGSSEPAWVGNTHPVEGGPLHQALGDPRRLGALAATGLLEHPRPEAFGRVTRLPRAIFGVSFTLVSLVDADREIHLGVSGFPSADRSPGEVPLDSSIAARVVPTCEAYVVENAHADAELRRDPAFIALGVASCALLPLVDGDGFVLG